jgi:hypothetical protein
LQKQKLIYNKYFEQKIIMSYFIQAKEHDGSMHAKIKCMNIHGVL